MEDMAILPHSAAKAKEKVIMAKQEKENMRKAKEKEERETMSRVAKENMEKAKGRAFRAIAVTAENLAIRRRSAEQEEED